jgi:3-hydroxyacyl-[acyl-carrier-protein] dehydratase
MKTEGKVILQLNKSDIEGLIPHRGQMLLLDCAWIIETSEGAILEAAYLISEQSVFMDGHFPGLKIFPGFLTAEAMAQTAGLNYSYFHREIVGKRFVLAAADNLRWTAAIFPGMRIFLRARYLDTVEKGGRIFVSFEVSAAIDAGSGERTPAARGIITGALL